jgi:hypothetical protein
LLQFFSLLIARGLSILAVATVRAAKNDGKQTEQRDGRPRLRSQQMMNDLHDDPVRHKQLRKIFLGIVVDLSSI